MLKVLIAGIAVAVTGCIGQLRVPEVLMGVEIGRPPPSAHATPPTVPRPGAVEQAPLDPFPNLPKRTSFTARASVTLKPGVYRGDFSLGRSQIHLTGSGQDKTIIDGSLFINGSQCSIKNLTVLGNVTIKGNQNRLIDVDYRGAVEDNGVQNSY